MVDLDIELSAGSIIMTTVIIKEMLSITILQCSRIANYINAANEQDRVSFIGRLGTYRYLDMHKVIRESLEFAEVINRCSQNGKQVPIFPLEKNELLS